MVENKVSNKRSLSNLALAKVNLQREKVALKSNKLSIAEAKKNALTLKKFEEVGGGRGGRETAAKNILASIGALPGRSAQKAGAGRPRGTYKYGLPIQEYKKLQSQRKAVYQQYAQEQENRLAQRGLTADQVQEAQLARTVSQASTQQQQFQSQMQSRPKSQIQIQMPNNQMEGITNAADDELNFQRFLAQNTISPNTQKIIDNLRRTQNKALADDINQQRVHRERKIVNELGSLMRARNLFGPDSNKVDIFDDQNNILKAPNVFSQESGINILRTGRPTLLNTKDTGGNLKFF